MLITVILPILSGMQGSLLSDNPRAEGGLAIISHTNKNEKQFTKYIQLRSKKSLKNKNYKKKGFDFSCSFSGTGVPSTTKLINSPIDNI